MAKQKAQIIAVHVTPRSGCDAVSGVRADANGQPVVQVRTKAAPEGGKANAGVCAALAKSLGVSKSSVSIYRGETARTKLVAIDADEDVVTSWMESLPTV
ncbi:MAG: DUF167 domain-containing protein [Eggerthellaceae bacterium]|nr:DUF167 domain-containing protein [Eggerthellaceae bacterium]